MDYEPPAAALLILDLLERDAMQTRRRAYQWAVLPCFAAAGAVIAWQYAPGPLALILLALACYSAGFVVAAILQTRATQYLAFMIQASLAEPLANDDVRLLRLKVANDDGTRH